jgi:hypothetical protein
MSNEPTKSKKLTPEQDAKISFVMEGLMALLIGSIPAMGGCLIVLGIVATMLLNAGHPTLISWLIGTGAGLVSFFPILGYATSRTRRRMVKNREKNEIRERDLIEEARTRAELDRADAEAHEAAT